MNGSGSAPMTIAPGWPHGVQQTTLPGGVFRYTPGVPYEDCCRYFCRASAGEATSMPRPRTGAINPTRPDVKLTLARAMIPPSVPDPRSGKYDVRRRHKPANVHHICVSAVAAHLRCEQTR